MMEVTWRQEAWARPCLRQRVRTQPVTGVHRPACTEIETRPPPQWLYNLKGIPQNTLKDDKSQVSEHISERSREAGLRFALHLMWYSQNHQEKQERSRAAVPRQRHRAQPFLMLPWLCCPRQEPSRFLRWLITAQPQQTQTELCSHGAAVGPCCQPGRAALPHSREANSSLSSSAVASGAAQHVSSRAWGTSLACIFSC